MNNLMGHQSGKLERWHLLVGGVVQGVGFRPFVANLASTCGVSGGIKNTAQGVVVDAVAQPESLARFVRLLETRAPRLAHIHSLHIDKVVCDQAESNEFKILPSKQGDGRTYVSADVAVCEDCLKELFDPQNHRFLYPFINCTHCGPRFTIIQSMPYDRPNTTMAEFEMCSVCEQEYQDAHNRRYHAQPIACPVCGPQVWYESAGGEVCVSGVDLWDEVSGRLKAGEILALRGLGGFHIACLATDKETIGRLRKSKLRPSKPLAVMVPSVVCASDLVWGNEDEYQMLASAEAPIVLMRKKAGVLPEGIAPFNAYVGVMLPYTPLHHLLLNTVQEPLVMTSGNQRGAPICKDNTEARQMLADGVDGFVFHNRPIHRRCDDSVVMVCDFGAKKEVQHVRRSRGFTPLPVILPKSLTLKNPVLATGGDLKNVSAIAAGQEVFLTAHIGDLTHPQARCEQQEALVSLQNLFDIQPECVVCDMHPQYASTQFAKGNEDRRPVLTVQHHHAHIASCMVDAGVQEGDVIGLAFDGTGYGTDGHIWGGEVLRCNWRDFERLFHLEYMPLPGGDAATLKPYRIALAYAMVLCPKREVTRFFPTIPTSEIGLIRQMVSQNIQTPLTSSMGRLFDAVASLLHVCLTAEHEAQAAMALEAESLKWTHDGAAYPVVFEGKQICLQPVFEKMFDDLKAGASVAYIARCFHQTVAEMAVASAIKARETCGLKRVALSGGVWQNRLLLKLAYKGLVSHGFDVLIHRTVPANDGGLALGQVAVAAAKMKEDGHVFGRSWSGCVC